MCMCMFFLLKCICTYENITVWALNDKNVVCVFFKACESDNRLNLRASGDWVCVAITAQSSLSPIQLCVYVYMCVCEF